MRTLVAPIIFAGALAGTLHAAPPNDEYRNATVLAAEYDQVEGSTIGAGREAGESGSRGPSAWYKWTSPGYSSRATVSLEIYTPTGYSTAHYLDVFQASGSGLISELIYLGYVYVNGGQVENEFLSAAPNTTYYFRVATRSTNSDTSNFRFTLDKTPRDSWSNYRNQAGALYNYFASYGDYNSAAAYYFYYQGLGNYNYNNAFGKYPEAQFAYYEGFALYYMFLYTARGDSWSARYYYNLNFAYAYYYYFLGKGDYSSAISYYSYFLG